MESTQEKSNATSHHGIDEQSDKSVQLRKFDDLNDFCLLNILRRLDLQSLLNVADGSNKRLRALATDAYQRKFGAKTVSISRFDEVHKHSKVKESSDTIQVHGLKASLQYLRCFGAFIDDLSIGYGGSKNKRYEYVHEYVNNFCAESLARITFDGMQKITMEKFQNGFANIQDVKFVHCNLHKEWASVVRLFANLRGLSFSETIMVYRSIEKPFPYLERLSIEGLRCDGSTPFKVVADLLDGVSQLKCLEIGYHEYNDHSSMSIAELLDLIEGNPLISVVSVFPVYGSTTSAEMERLINDHPALVELGLEECTFTPDQAIALIPQLASLKKFAFHTQVNYCSDERDELFEKIDGLGWDLSIGDTGCFLPTMTYDMHLTVTRREQ